MSTCNYPSIFLPCINGTTCADQLTCPGIMARHIPSPYDMKSHPFPHFHQLSTWSDSVAPNILFVRICQVVNSRFSPASEASMSPGRLLRCRELVQAYAGKELTVSILSVTCCVSPGSCHFLPFIFHRRSTLRFALASIHSPLCCHFGRSGGRLQDQRWHY